ncbi:MAG: TAXI family TRAP transporter solute-binding subunit [Aestuariivirgaceae bacterium]
MSFRVLLSFLTFLIVGGASAAVNAQAIDVRAQRDLVNAGTVGIVSGGVTGTYVRFASDLSNALDKGYEHRILTILGKGSVRNIEDLLMLKGIDIAIVQSDVLDFYRNSMGHLKVEKKIDYITKLYNEEVHVLARSGTPDIASLRGKRVNFGTQGSGTFMTASIIFDALGVEVEVTTLSEQIALAKLREGAIDALVFVGGKPVTLLREISPEDKLVLLPIPADQIKGAYLAGTLTSKTYPNLIDEGKTVSTVAVGAVMAAYSWPADHPRHAKVKRFVDRFFDNFSTFQQAPFHQKWKEVDLRAEVPGWRRFSAAATWLNNHP